MYLCILYLLLLLLYYITSRLLSNIYIHTYIYIYIYIYIYKHNNIYRKGTNGGVSFIGLLASAGGGISIGLGHAIYDLIFVRSYKRSISKFKIFTSTVLFGGSMGLIGSMIDSILGAFFQYSGSVDITVGKEVIKRIVTNPNHPNNKWITGINILSNHQVNLISIILTSFIGYYTSEYFFGIEKIKRRNRKEKKN